MSDIRIFYIGFFDFQDSTAPRRYIVSAVNKMLYISRVLQKITPLFQIVSIAWPTGERLFYRGGTINKDGLKCHFFSFPGFIKRSQFKDIWRGLCLFFYGVIHFKKSDVIVSYHSTSYAAHSLVVLRRIIKFKLILEVEEIYSSLLTTPNKVWKRESESFSNCDGFIFSTELLANKINTKNLPNAVIYGTYQTGEQQQIKTDDKIHVIYAGTFDPKKGGALAAVAAAEYLPPNYQVHICGFGNDSQIEEIKNRVFLLQHKGCGISYEGLLKGQAYLDMLHKCQIGLSTQDPSATFNNTSFPSKILSYMASGLAVVSIRIEAVQSSKIGAYICYYDNQTPKEIADSIMRCDITQGPFNKRVISSLDKEFQSNIRHCIEELICL